ncbi:Signal transduction histidine kinase [Magnetospirillum sp. XM-1]|uniref:ATP-binding protein n=1 Tax=Magnetospirillum sp. XM-1 TaxID=1663591 RepID=UPI00073DE6C3|nr:ATP-binding protein [Magnetospirillum sp. XM-1]CUW40600.1 Signal transduction histidine kinase [Magnetospirillum sp. XM-1]
MGVVPPVAGIELGRIEQGESEAPGFGRLRRWLIAAFVSANLFLVIAYLVVVWLGPRYTMEETGRSMRTLALALSEQVEATIRSEAAILTSLQREIRARGGVDAFSETAWYEMFMAHLNLFSDDPADKPLHALFFVNANGVASASSVSNPTRQADASMRPYFAFHRDRPGDELFISELSQSKITGLWVFFLTQRISGEDGSFQGVIGISLRVNRFEDLFERLRLPADGTIAIHRLDGAPLYRYPFTEAFAQTQPGAFPGLGAMIAKRSGHDERVSPFDGSSRIIGYNVGRSYPVLAVATVTREGALAGWRRTLSWFTGLGIAALGLGGMLFAFSLKHLGSLEREAWLRRLSEAVDQNPNMIITTDPDGVIDYANPSFCRFTGFSLDEVIGKTPRIQKTEETPPETYAELWRTILGGNEWRGELLNRCKDDSTYWASVVISPVIDEGGKLRGFVGQQEDISERKRIEGRVAELVAELKQSNEELEQFAYVASHDLRQPLRMINSYMELLRRKLKPAFDDEASEYFAFATDGAKRLDRMIADLLEFSRIGRQSSMEPVDLNGVLADGLRNLGIAIRDAGAKVQVADGLPTVRGDRSELTRLFQNLIGNAVKYCPPDRAPQVEVSCRDTGHEWLFAVQDNGIGIDPECLDKVFGIFQRMVSREQYEGTGIGLAVCRKVAEHHGGRIWVESEVEQGSTFFLSLPKA